jgi:DNA-directed RNA polymerase subunit RPC12/RpoP
MSFHCVECGGNLDLPETSQGGDIFSCPDCGTDFVVEMNDNGEMVVKELNLEEEDWGE